MKTDTKQNFLPYSTRLLGILLKVTFILLIFHLLLQSLNWLVYHQQQGQIYELANRFDLDDEASVPTWFSQIFYLVIGILALLAAYLQTNRSIQRIWQVIAGFVFLFSIDEVAGLHEYFLQTLHVIFWQDASPTNQNNAWLLVAPFIVLGGAWFVWKALKLLPRRTIFLFGVAGLTLIIGAVFVDLLGSVVERESFLQQGVFVAAEEMLELLGSIIGLYAVADYLERYHIKEIAGALRHLKASRRSESAR